MTMDTGNTAIESKYGLARPGRYFTLIVTVVVLGLTAGAFFNNRGLFGAGGLKIALPGGLPPAKARQRFASLARQLASVSEGSVTYVEPSEGADLYIHSLVAFLEAGPKLGLVPLWSIAAAAGEREEAVLITAAAGPISFAQLSPSEVAFTAPDDPNGFWAQLAWLRERGFRIPERRSDFRFEGNGEYSVRVVYGVLWGRYKIGACRISDLARLLDRGLLREGEVRIVAGTAALPDFIISARPEEAGRLTDRLAALPAVLSPAGAESPLVIVPADETALRRARQLAGDLAAGL